MTFENKLKIYLVALGALAVAMVLGLWLLPQMPWNQRQTVFLADKLNVDLVESMVLGDNINLTKQEGQWMLSYQGTLFPLKDEMGESFLDDIKGVRVNQQITDDPSRAAEFGLDADVSSISILGAENAPLLTIRIGNAREDGRGFYANLGEGLPVLWLNSDINQALDRSPEEWALLRLLDPSPAVSGVLRVRLEGEGTLDLGDEKTTSSYILTRVQGEAGAIWQAQGALAEIEELDQNRLDSMVRNMVNLQGKTLLSRADPNTQNLGFNLIIESEMGQYSYQIGNYVTDGVPVTVNNRNYLASEFLVRSALVYED